MYGNAVFIMDRDRYGHSTIIALTNIHRSFVRSFVRFIVRCKVPKFVPRSQSSFVRSFIRLLTVQ